MSGTKIIQTWAIEDGAITLNVRRNTKPLPPDAVVALTPIVAAIEEFVSEYAQPAGDRAEATE